ncbi:phage minor head protein [Treponema phagedenis]|uniref:Phage head morphogenesis domain-containing protein n=1 Tax=Treponema phagedenis TaxID=162 RepID=A0AAE6M6X9_TREPH|nr:phage minor head protein [Treponema phagedenis]QEJ96779.1 hypothetical protein FUT82_01420 [Treponema phagedenis]
MGNSLSHQCADAYTAGRLTQYASNPPRAWELLVIQDGRTTDICNNIASIAGNGKALKADHPFWTVYGFPPYHFNCRTTIRAYTIMKREQAPTS